MEAWLDLLDAEKLASVCAVEDGEYVLNATARADLQRAALGPEEASAILERKEIVPVVADPGLLVWKRRAERDSRVRLDSLSRREREVSGWLRKGKSADGIGVILGISPRTVEKHIEKIYAKCGVRSHVEFVRLSFDDRV